MKESRTYTVFYSLSLWHGSHKLLLAAHKHDSSMQPLFFAPTCIVKTDRNKTSGRFYLGLKNNVRVSDIALFKKEEGITV